MADQLIITCGTCGKEIAKSALTCPNCGAKQKKKWGWGKKILVGVGGFFLFLMVVGAMAGNSNKPTPATNSNSASAPDPGKQQSTKPTTDQPTQTSKQETYNWNTKEIDARENGNMHIAVKKMKADGNIKNMAIIASPSDIAKRPWDFYGKVIKFTGVAAVVQDYPPGNELSKLMGGSCAEVVIETEDGTIVDAFVEGSSGSLKVGQNSTIYGYPVGITEVANKVGGKFTHLIIIGQL